jgi:CubicO group peptidase (beta-lactamase class C family)
MVQSIFLVLALLVFGSVTGRAVDLDAEVGRLLAGRLLPDGPGVAIVVVRDGRPILKKTVGLANVADRLPITERTLFDLASVSKPITGLAVLHLIERGRLDLDAAVSSVVPEFRVPVRGRPITIRDLLQHTSGLRDYTSDYPGSDQVFAKLTTEGHVEWLNTTRPKSAPGVRFEYNNSNYTLLARVVERVTSRTFADFMKRRILRRARMRASFVYDGTAALPPLAAEGYIVRGARARPSQFLTNIAGDGNVYTSVRDLTVFLRRLTAGRIVRERTLDQAWTNGRLDNGRPIKDGGVGYGLGWEVEGDLRSHTGSWAGTSTYLSIDTAIGLGVAVLSNDENFDTYRLGESIRKAVSR